MTSRLCSSSVLLSLTLFGSLACDEPAEKSASKSGRSDGVISAAGATKPVATAEAKGPAPKEARKGSLCSSTTVRGLPEDRISGLGTSSLPFSGGALPKGGLVWVNLWAAWCEPCKKELPLLQKWKSALKAKGIDLNLAFLSIDDDKRQLSQFLEKNTAGLESTYWLEEGAMRDSWLKKAELPQDPRLPVHLVANASGDIVCQIDGAIEESDFSEVEKLLTSAR